MPCIISQSLSLEFAQNIYDFFLKVWLHQKHKKRKKYDDVLYLPGLTDPVFKHHPKKLICVADRTFFELTGDLSLQDSVSHAPQSRKDKENPQVVRVWPPVEKANDTGDVRNSS